MTLAFFTAPALLLAAIAGTGVLLGGVIVCARNRQRRMPRNEASVRDMARRDENGTRGG